MMINLSNYPDFTMKKSSSTLSSRVYFVSVNHPLFLSPGISLPYSLSLFLPYSLSLSLSVSLSLSLHLCLTLSVSHVSLTLSLSLSHTHTHQSICPLSSAILSGKELFNYNSSLFVDDEGAIDASEENALAMQTKIGQ